MYVPYTSSAITHISIYVHFCFIFVFTCNMLYTDLHWLNLSCTSGTQFITSKVIKDSHWNFAITGAMMFIGIYANLTWHWKCFKYLLCVKWLFSCYQAHSWLQYCLGDQSGTRNCWTVQVTNFHQFYECKFWLVKTNWLCWHCIFSVYIKHVL